MSVDHRTPRHPEHGTWERWWGGVASLLGPAAAEQPTSFELACRFGLDEHALVTNEVIEPFPRDAHHQPRLRRGTRVRVFAAHLGNEPYVPIYRVEVLDEHGRPSRYWAEVPETHLTEAPELPFLDWLRSLAT